MHFSFRPPVLNVHWLRSGIARLAIGAFAVKQLPQLLDDLALAVALEREGEFGRPFVRSTGSLNGIPVFLDTQQHGLFLTAMGKFGRLDG